MADETPATIAATEKKEVAIIEAKQASEASEASALMETLDKLQEFKRYSIALVFLAIFGAAIALFGLIIGILAYRGQYDVAVDGAKWMIAIIGTTVGTIIGFYFGSNVVSAKAG